MRGVLKRLSEVHDRVLPYTSSYVPVQALSRGGWPEELWGGRERMQRRIRLRFELFLLTLLLLVGGSALLNVFVAKQHMPLAIGLWLGVLAPPFMWLAWHMSTISEFMIEERAQKAAESDPGALRVEWGKNPYIHALILRQLQGELGSEELEVALVLEKDFTGTARELIEASRALCRTDLA